MAATLTDPLLGHLVDGRYEVLSRIARGGMATVYLANDRRLDREVALKVMHAHLAEGGAGSEFVARFRREARAAARLTHPGLVGVFDQGVDGETSYLTMEYVDGTNLRRHLIERGALSVEESFTTIEAVLDALSAAHRSGLVHRDIKPENVLLASDGRVKVADFGLARAVTEVTATTTGTVLGTVAYLAPELVAHGISDTRTDVYAAGILLYEMITGRQPFTGATPIQVAYQHVNSDIPAASEAEPWLPMEVDELLGALAARDPADRPAHATAALELVRRTREALDPATLSRRADVAPAVTAVGTDGRAGTTIDAEPDDDAPADAEQPADGEQPTAAAATATPDPNATAVLSTGRPAALPEPDDAPGRTMALQIGTGLDAPVSADGIPAGETVDPRWRRRVLMLLSAIAVAAVAGILGIWYTVYGPGAYSTVPGGLVGAELAQAESVLDEAGLQVTTLEDHHPEVAAGHVIASSPTEGEQIPNGGTVELTVSLGPDMRTVPSDLEGQPADAVTAALTEVGFVVSEPSHEHDDVVQEGHVITVSEEGGTELPLGSEVSLVVSDGPAPVTISSLVGVERDRAVELLEDDGLVVAEEQDYSTEHAEGVVMAQVPEPGTQSTRTQTVIITISQGPPPVEVPDVNRSGVAAATEELRDAGFEVRTERAGAYFGLGFVVGQDPEAGSMAPLGSVVTLTIT